jgi:hypothetical protein
MASVTSVLVLSTLLLGIGAGCSNGATQPEENETGKAVCTSDGCWDNPLPQGDTLNALWGNSANDVWAVGEPGVILHWDGRAWSKMTSGTTLPLFDVWSSQGGDVWATGRDGAILRHRP